MAGLLTDEEMIDQMYGPNADTPTSEIYRLLGLNPNLRRSTILPIARNEQGGLEAAVPQSLIDLARAFRLPARAMGGGSYGPEDIANFALNTGALGAVGTKPAGALASGAARTSKPSALPMDEASRMARAAEQGFTTDAYHGTGADIRSFDLQAPKVTGGGLNDAGVFVSTDPVEASRYARTFGGDSANVLPLKVRTERPLTLAPGVFERLQDVAYMQRNGHAVPEVKGIFLQDDLAQAGVAWDGKGSPVEAIRAAGYDAISKGGRYPETVVFDPKNIRSRFAAFDPAKKDSADLLAGVIGLPGGSFLTGLNQERSKRGISKIAK